MAPTLMGETVLMAEASLGQQTKHRNGFPQTKLNNNIGKVEIPSHSKQNGDVAKEDAVTEEEPYRLKFVWRNVLIFLYLHIAALYGFYILITGKCKFWTFLFGFAMGQWGGLGVTAGAHRLWAHKAYKAKWPARLFLVLGQTVAFQNSVHEWVRDHRVHHKFTDTNADPHNAKRGFWFSHMGWLLVRKHPDVKNKGGLVPMDDVEQDEIVMFQHRHFLKLMPIMCFILPTLIPYYCFGETLANSWYVAACFRYIYGLHLTWTVNSVAHIWGYKPYDKNISPTNNSFVSHFTNGEGWHNYHHTFPWDYKASEYPTYYANMTTWLIDFFAVLGWTYDLKTVPQDMIKNRILRTGDGTHPVSKESNEEDLKNVFEEPEHIIWGWDDPDMTEDEKKIAEIRLKSD